MVKVYLVPKRLCAQMGRQLALKQEAQGPFITHLITNSKQFSQQKDNQNDRIQINTYACVVGSSLKEDFVKGEALPTKFHQHPSSSPIVKADYVCSHHALVHPPFLHLNKYIKISLKFIKHLNFLY